MPVLKAHVLHSPVIFGDDTTMALVEGGRGKTRTARLWSMSAPVPASARMEHGKTIRRPSTSNSVQPVKRATGVPYAALDLSGQTEAVETLDTSRPVSAVSLNTRSNFHVGDRVVFTDHNSHSMFGKIIHMNPKIASIDSDHGSWRVSYQLLKHIVALKHAPLASLHTSQPYIGATIPSSYANSRTLTHNEAANARSKQVLPRTSRLESCANGHR